MIGAVVIQNLAYLIGAIVLIVIVSLAVTLHHRKPKSVEANMASFHKGLKALSPEAQPVRRRHASVSAPPVPAKPRSVTTVLPTDRAAATDPDPGPDDDTTTEAETG